MPDSQQRRLVAVMFTDIVGYTALTGVSETAARAARSRHREALESSIPAHNGQLIQYYGDGSLSIFPSAVEAALAALELQQAVQAEPGLPLRIGIDEGDIMIDGPEVIGPAVNMASRIQNLGEAGTVLVSDKVFNELENQTALRAKLLGEFQLKGVARPVRVYTVAVRERADGEAVDPTPTVETSGALIRRLNEALEPEYVIESEVDRDGAGLVFAARDVTLERRVAIKVIRPDLATPSTVERFLRAARLLARLRHPNIVPVHRAGTAHGYPYYVMDLLTGDTLADRLASGAMPPALALSIARGLLDALGAAHAVGLIHGDVQPRNMLLAGDSVVLSGFGLSGRRSRAAPALERGDAPPTRQEPSDDLVTVHDDVYAVGSVLYEMVTGRPWPGAGPANADWTGVPRRLLAPLRRALAPAPERRWSSASHFRRALVRPLLVSGPVRRALASAALLAAVILALLLWPWHNPDPASTTTMRLADVAILPFQTLPGPDSVFAAQLTTLAARYLKDVPRLVMTPVETVNRWWQQADAAARDDSRRASRELGARYLVSGFLVPHRDSIDVQLALIDSLGRQLGGSRIDFRVLGADLTDAPKLVAHEILRRFQAQFDTLPWRGSPTRNFDALVAFLHGEHARYGGAWQRAAEHYTAALARDSLFAEARWQLVNVWRWMPGRTPPLRPHLEKLAAAGTEDLSPLDRRLVQAQLTPAGEQRLHAYRTAVASSPRDAYAALLYGEELFHRGALIGQPADSATKWLERAASLDPNLAPTFELLAWHYIRLGDRVGAQRAVQRLGALFEIPAAAREIAYARLLEQAYFEKFDTAHALSRRQAMFGESTPYALSQLDFAVRAGLAFRLPRVQLQLGRIVATHTALDRVERANGHVAQALAHAALGRGAAALAHFDSAVTLDPTPEHRLMAAQWRVMPPALGYAFVAGAERDRGLAELQWLATDSLTAARAIWSLALHAHSAGASAAAAQHRRQLATRSDSIARHLGNILDAIRLAAADRTADALRVTEPLLAYDAGGEHGDPFARTALHLARGSWLARNGDRHNARRSWLWAENTDIRPWLGGAVQAAEVDWVFSPYATYLRALSALEDGDRSGGCAELARAIHDWADAEERIRSLGTSAARTYHQSCRSNSV